jgi:chromosome segregation ATPase
VGEKPALKGWAAAALIAGLAACASMPPPHQQMGAARAMVAQAHTVAAQDAPLELSTAQTKLARAEEAMKRADYVNARILAEQAEVDAKYAWTLAENARAQRASAEVNQGINALRQELERRGQ